jgi:hypothetical protein
MFGVVVRFQSQTGKLIPCSLCEVTEALNWRTGRTALSRIVAQRAGKVDNGCLKHINDTCAEVAFARFSLADTTLINWEIQQE